LEGIAGQEKERGQGQQNFATIDFAVRLFNQSSGINKIDHIDHEGGGIEEPGDSVTGGRGGMKQQQRRDGYSPIRGWESD